MEKSALLSSRQLMMFALPAMPLAAFHSPITVYLPPFFGTEMGLGLGTVGLIFILARVWDIVTDLVLGIATDKLPSRWGRRRHWIVISVPILLIAVVTVFMPRMVVGSSVTAAYLLFWLIILYIGYTMATLSQYSWAAELTDDYNQRSRIMGWREFFHLFGMLTVLTMPAVIELGFGNTSLGDKVAAMGWYVVVLLPITVALAVCNVPEYPALHNTQPPWREGLRILAGNRLFRRVLATDVMVGIPGGVMGALYVFFVMDVLREPKWLTLILLGFFAAGLVGVPLTVKISYHVGKHNAIIICKGAMLLITLAFLFVGPSDVVFFAVLIALSGLIFNGLNGMLRAITADITDRDQLHTGAIRTGLYYAMLTLTSKVGYALALITYPVLEWLGYKAGAMNSDQAISALRYTFVFFPMVALIVGMALMWRFPLGRKEQAELRQQLAARAATGTASAVPLASSESLP